MTDQLTQCPHCQTTFRVTPTQLGAAKGLVRCGSCLGLFSASINFIRLKPAADELDDELSDSPATAARTSLQDDDIALGDLDLDEDYAEEEDPDEPDETEAELEDVDMVSAMEEAEEILLESIQLPEPVEIRQFLTYEEYQDVPDLFDQLDQEDALAASAQAHAEEAAASAAEPPEELEAEELNENDLETADLEEPDDEFHPPGFSEEDEDEIDEDEEDEDDAVLATAIEDLDTDLVATDSEIDLEDQEDFDLQDEDEDEDEDEQYSAATALTDESLDTPEANAFAYDEDEVDVEAFLDEFQDESEQDAAVSSKAKPAWLTQPGANTEEKAKLHGYLSTLADDDEALQPLADSALDALEPEPVLLAAHSNKRSLLASASLLLLSLLLLATLVLQFVDQHLDQLSTRSSFTSYKPLFCRILDCPAPEQEPALSSLYSQELLIRTHPRISSALELSFIFRNDSRSAQNFPGLELSFRDIDNKLLANRVFLPREYLPAELRQLQQMPAMSSLQVLLELVDPGEKAVNYTIAFREL